MHVPINIKSPNNISKWQMGFNSAFKGLIIVRHTSDIYTEWKRVNPLQTAYILSKAILVVYFQMNQRCNFMDVTMLIDDIVHEISLATMETKLEVLTL
jgi:hypothetical protein